MKLLKELLNESAVKFMPNKLKGFAKENGLKLVKRGELVDLIDAEGHTVGTFNKKNNMLDTKLDTTKFIQF